MLKQALRGRLAGRVAVLSSFGSEAALLLAMVAAIDRTTPVLFLETRRHFAETLAYRAVLAERLGLTDVRDLVPDPAEERLSDPDGELWFEDPDSCCALRKVRPLETALAPFAAVVTGRKRHQSAARAALAPVTVEAGRVRINPLCDWEPARIRAETARRDLPAHPLVARGYPSIGCANCTRPVRAGEHGRAGRWHGRAKTECGIHPPTG